MCLCTKPNSPFEMSGTNLVWGIISGTETERLNKFLISYLGHKVSHVKIERTHLTEDFKIHLSNVFSS